MKSSVRHLKSNSHMIALSVLAFTLLSSWQLTYVSPCSLTQATSSSLQPQLQKHTQCFVLKLSDSSYLVPAFQSFIFSQETLE